MCSADTVAGCRTLKVACRLPRVKATFAIAVGHTWQASATSSRNVRSSSRGFSCRMMLHSPPGNVFVWVEVVVGALSAGRFQRSSKLASSSATLCCSASCCSSVSCASFICKSWVESERFSFSCRANVSSTAACCAFACESWCVVASMLRSSSSLAALRASISAVAVDNSFLRFSLVWSAALRL
ncbi:hypothetical protein ABL78_8457 [Leptomonas seymouri]|uniref:Uncharacterized protein n=1 Tax=Leptomonas seymouri TaxID=5684 RepID=A0A0N1P979_LEPSE|nr:hypothetical protein ABL78_8457 [Leptomonas seymouri]|eukprot:KPI82533.1 hypothetical protein ABL78_8457 [Leptomonas seymouri]